MHCNAITCDLFLFQCTKERVSSCMQRSTDELVFVYNSTKQCLAYILIPVCIAMQQQICYINFFYSQRNNLTSIQCNETVHNLHVSSCICIAVQQFLMYCNVICFVFRSQRKELVKELVLVCSAVQQCTLCAISSMHNA